MLLLMRSLMVLALGVWLGAMLFFSAGTAPAAFAALPDRVLAGNVVNGAMRTLHVMLYVCGGLALVGYAVRLALEPWLRRWTLAKLAIVALMLGLTLYSGLAVSPPLAEIRRTVGAIDALPAGDPVKERFASLHKLSVMLMGINLLGVTTVLVLEQVRGRQA